MIGGSPEEQAILDQIASSRGQEFAEENAELILEAGARFRRSVHKASSETGCHLSVRSSP
jgi:hypothetical protein